MVQWLTLLSSLPSCVAFSCALPPNVLTNKCYQEWYYSNRMMGLKEETKINSSSKKDELENCLCLFKDSLFFYNYVDGNRTSECKPQVESDVFITMGH